MNRTQVSRRAFLEGLAGAGVFAGMRAFAAPSGMFSMGKANLVFGIVTDIHVAQEIDKAGNLAFVKNHDTETFKAALRWFDGQGVDAVVLCGDMADRGLVSELQTVADAWFGVFPDDRAADGRKVERVFVTGNHDWEGQNYGTNVQKMYPDEAEFARRVLRTDLAKNWKEIFHEDFASVFRKDVKGYAFVGAHWCAGKRCGGRDEQFNDDIEAFYAANGTKLPKGRPFFHVQHPHPKDTCYGPWAWGRDAGQATRALSAFPNAIALSGHSHYALTDERSIWQGAFTSVGCGSLRYPGTPYDSVGPNGYENTSCGLGREGNKDKMSGIVAPRGRHLRNGLLVRVFDDRIVLERHEFTKDRSLGCDWVIPLAGNARPFAFETRAKASVPPDFAVDAKLELSRGRKTKWGGDEVEAYTVKIPGIAPQDGVARLWDYVVAAESSDGQRQEKRLLAYGYGFEADDPVVSQGADCSFEVAKLGPAPIKFTVWPCDCFGNRGKAMKGEFR